MYEAMQGSHQGPLTYPSSSHYSRGWGSHVGALAYLLVPAKASCLSVCLQGMLPSRWQGLKSN